MVYLIFSMINMLLLTPSAPYSGTYYTQRCGDNFRNIISLIFLYKIINVYKFACCVIDNFLQILIEVISYNLLSGDCSDWKSFADLINVGKEKLSDEQLIAAQSLVKPEDPFIYLCSSVKQIIFFFTNYTCNV